MHENIDKIALSVHGVIAFAGGFVRALQQNKVQPIEILISTVIAGFTGTLFGMLAMYFLSENSYLTLSIAGIGGLLGEKGIFFLLEIFKKTIKVNLK